MITIDHFATLQRSQRGAVLMVVLVMLVVMSLLAVSSLRGTLFQERMSASQLDRGIAFQAAEAALRAGELVAAGKPTMPASGCSAGLCATPIPSEGTSPVWKVETNWSSASTLTSSFSNLSSQPKYLVELLTSTAPSPGSTGGSGAGSSSSSGSVDCNDVSVACGSSGSGSGSGGSGSGSTTSRYRITARVQMANRATVMLQSIYAVP